MLQIVMSPDSTPPSGVLALGSQLGSQYPYPGKALIGVHFSCASHWEALGSQIARQVPGGEVPAQTLPGAHSMVVLQVSPVAAVPAGQTQAVPIRESR